MKREEAIKILKELHDGALFSVRNALETLIPELAESEEERIRLDIVALINFALEDGSAVSPGSRTTKEEALCYLEKQKEPLSVPDKFSGLKSLMLQYLQSAANRKDDAEIESDTDLFGRKILDYVWKQDEKQKEQMPAEWSKEDEKMLEILISNYEFLSKKYRDEEKDFFCSLSIVQDDLDMSEWLEKRLKSLRPQPHWKPSEQERGALRTAIHVLTDERSFPKAAAQLQNILDAFEEKESRKGWKPSKEQMKELEKIIKYQLACGLHASAGLLQELIDELRKLM